jgi:hypothetical protein
MITSRFLFSPPDPFHIDPLGSYSFVAHLCAVKFQYPNMPEWFFRTIKNDVSNIHNLSPKIDFKK